MRLASCNLLPCVVRGTALVNWLLLIEWPCLWWDSCTHIQWMIIVNYEHHICFFYRFRSLSNCTSLSISAKLFASIIAASMKTSVLVELIYCLRENCIVCCFCWYMLCRCVCWQFHFIACNFWYICTIRGGILSGRQLEISPSVSFCLSTCMLGTSLPLAIQKKCNLPIMHFTTNTTLVKYNVCDRSVITPSNFTILERYPTYICRRACALASAVRLSWQPNLDDARHDTVSLRHRKPNFLVFSRVVPYDLSCTHLYSILHLCYGLTPLHWQTLLLVA